MSQHTPGPWVFDEECVYGANGGRVACVTDNCISTAGCIANGMLIAAAPDLLEACKAAKKYLEPDLVEPGRTVFWDLVAAINKAVGTQATDGGE